MASEAHGYATPNDAALQLWVEIGELTGVVRGLRATRVVEDADYRALLVAIGNMNVTMRALLAQLAQADETRSAVDRFIADCMEGDDTE